jgi:hypothetical protein
MARGNQSRKSDKRQHGPKKKAQRRTQKRAQKKSQKKGGAKRR